MRDIGYKEIIETISASNVERVLFSDSRGKITFVARLYPEDDGSAGRMLVSYQVRPKKDGAFGEEVFCLDLNDALEVLGIRKGGDGTPG